MWQYYIIFSIFSYSFLNAAYFFNTSWTLRRYFYGIPDNDGRRSLPSYLWLHLLNACFLTIIFELFKLNKQKNLIFRYYSSFPKFLFTYQYSRHSLKEKDFQGIFFQMETSGGSEKYGDTYIFQLWEGE